MMEFWPGDKFKIAEEVTHAGQAGSWIRRWHNLEVIDVYPYFVRFRVSGKYNKSYLESELRDREKHGMLVRR